MLSILCFSACRTMRAARICTYSMVAAITVLLWSSVVCAAELEGGLVLGEVYDAATGAPLADVKVTVFMTGYEYDPAMDYGKQAGATDAAGVYSVVYHWVEMDANFSLLGASLSSTLLTTSVRVRFEAPGKPPAETDLTAFGFTRRRTQKELKQKGLFGAFSMPSREELDWGWNHPRLFLPKVRIADDGTLTVCAYDEMFGFTDVQHGDPADIAAKGMSVSFKPVYPPTMNFTHLKMKAYVMAVRNVSTKKDKPMFFDADDNGKGGDVAKGDGVFTSNVKIKNFNPDEWMLAFILVNEANFLVNDGSFTPGTVIDSTTMSIFRPLKVQPGAMGPGSLGTPGTLPDAWAELTFQSKEDPGVISRGLGEGVKVIYAALFQLEAA